MPLNLTTDELQAFIHYGYVPRVDQLDLDGLLYRYGIVLRADKAREHEQQLVEQGAAILDSILADISRKFHEHKIIIPISGGMDSRAILAGMLKHLSAQQISTVTVGTAGTFDFEFGQMVASAAGVANTAVDLITLRWTEDALRAYAKRLSNPIVLTYGYMYSQVFRPEHEGGIYICGFMGDPIAGSHLLARDSEDWDTAKAKFAARNCYSGIRAPDGGLSVLPAKPYIDGRLLCFDEQLDFLLRQRLYIKPQVVPNTPRHITPFLHPEWVGFMLNLPRKMREKQYLYKKILLHAYPELFKLPLKNEEGLRLGSSSLRVSLHRVITRSYRIGARFLPFAFPVRNRSLNYIDISETFRSNPDVYHIFQNAISNAAELIPGGEIAMKELWESHMREGGKHRAIDAMISTYLLNTFNS